MKTKIYILSTFFIFLLTTNLSAQRGLKFAELAERLEQYFPKKLVLDVKNELPMGSDYSIWGWDVGDFSGDGYMDVAFSLKLTAEKKKQLEVYMFVNMDGYLTKVGQFTFDYVEIPLEIGCVIRHNACFVTNKRKQFNWLIKGYTYDNGSLIWLDEYTTERIGRLTHETYKNLRTLKTTIRYLQTNSGADEFSVNFLTIPCYRRKRQIYKGYSNEPYAYDVDFVQKGAYYWKGEEDGSYVVRSYYDNKFLYMTVEVHDDKVVTFRCDSCYGDFIEVWMDVIPPYLEDNDRFTIKKGSSIKFRTSSELGLYCFSIYPGDFREKKAFIKISTTDDLEDYQKQASRLTKVVSSLQDDGFTVKFRIPFTFLGFEETPIYEDDFTELGCTIVYHDIDNEYRPEEESQIATSVFSSMNPSTYGSLLLIPDDLWYGETINIYKDDILKTLTDYGF